MNPETAIDLFKTVVMFSLYTVAPFLVVTLVVGLVTSVLQSVTSIQEPTLTFAPKLFSVAATSVLLAPWLIRSLIEFTGQIIARIGTLGH
ncbi:MAG: flagellar type III secretion system protein FliQ [Opitutae bacterium]|nr:flagellar type III secretion system protein FliQ [Opitutae bacterium]